MLGGGAAVVAEEGAARATFALAAAFSLSADQEMLAIAFYDASDVLFGIGLDVLTWVSAIEPIARFASVSVRAILTYKIYHCPDGLKGSPDGREGVQHLLSLYRYC